MRNLTEDNVTEAVIRSFENTRDPRLKDVMTSLVTHLHGFIRDVKPSEAEWMNAITFLTEVGHMCQGDRQEFILLSDTLGASILMDAINHPAPEGITESSVLGPFYRDGAPILEKNASIARDNKGEPTVIHGRVTDGRGNPVKGAILDVWQTAPNGLYETQDPDQPDYNLRGCFQTDGNGHYQLRTVKPVSYPIPTDGPVGKLLEATGRHPYRPAHVHFIVSAEGYRPVTTQLFTAGDDYLDSDAVFGVKGSLVVQYRKHTDADRAREYGVEAPFYTVEHDFALKPQEASS